MTDLAGNNPDMIAQVKQGLTDVVEKKVNDWEVAKFEQILAQETAAIDPANNNDIAAKMSLDKLFEGLAKIDSDTKTPMQALSTIADQIRTKGSEPAGGNVDPLNSTFSSEVEEVGKFYSRLDEQMLSTVTLYETLGQHRSSMVKSGWIKEIAMSSVKSVKQTINQQG